MVKGNWYQNTHDTATYQFVWVMAGTLGFYMYTLDEDAWYSAKAARR